MCWPTCLPTSYQVKVCIEGWERGGKGGVGGGSGSRNCVMENCFYMKRTGQNI